jgi:hypothetical protein
MGCSHQKEEADTDKLIKEINELRTQLNISRSSLFEQTPEDHIVASLRAANCDKDRKILELVNALAEQQARGDELKRLDDELSAARGQLDQLEGIHLKLQNLFQEKHSTTQRTELPVDESRPMHVQDQKSILGSHSSHTNAKVFVLTYKKALETIEAQNMQIDRLRLELGEMQETAEAEKKESRGLLLHQEHTYQAEVLRLGKLIDALKTKLTIQKQTSSADLDSEATYSTAWGEAPQMSGSWDQLDESSLTTQTATDFRQMNPDEKIKGVEQRKDSMADRSEAHEEKMMKSQSTETRKNTVPETMKTARRRRQKGLRRYK